MHAYTGEFGDVCVGTLRSALTGAQSRVALKTLSRARCHDDKAQLDFLVEAAIMSHLEHPHIIRYEGIVLNSSTTQQQPMIVTEFMENGSLDAYLRVSMCAHLCAHNSDQYVQLLILSFRPSFAGQQEQIHLLTTDLDVAWHSERNAILGQTQLCSQGKTRATSHFLFPHS